MNLPQDLVQRLVASALEEDLAEGTDLSSEAVVPEALRARARILARAPGVLAGQDLARAAFRALDPECRFVEGLRDGETFAAGDALLAVEGKARAILGAERTALNFLQRLSGIATLTRAFVDAVRGTGAVILETRKTTPGLRTVEKYAVKVGGGENHRFGLFDRILLKENHFKLAGGEGLAGYRRAVARAVDHGGHTGPVAVEARSLAEAEAALEAGADIVLLDNFPLEELRAAVERLREKSRELDRDVLVEASGGITLETVARVAAAGVDRISIGALTHSAPAVDMSLLVEGALEEPGAS